jgi:hypothetical protein
MSDVNELRRQRRALEAKLGMLSEQKEYAFRVNSDALALQRAGVTHHGGAEMQQFADAEIAGDPTMTDLRRQIALIDDELERDHGTGLAGRSRSIMRWLRR